MVDARGLHRFKASYGQTPQVLRAMRFAAEGLQPNLRPIAIAGDPLPT